MHPMGGERAHLDRMRYLAESGQFPSPPPPTSAEKRMAESQAREAALAPHREKLAKREAARVAVPDLLARITERSQPLVLPRRTRSVKRLFRTVEVVEPSGDPAGWVIGPMPWTARFSGSGDSSQQAENIVRDFDTGITPTGEFVIMDRTQEPDGPAPVDGTIVARSPWEWVGTWDAVAAELEERYLR